MSLCGAGQYQCPKVGVVRHELWDEGDDGATFCLSGRRGDGARGLLGPKAQLVWEVEAESHFEAMSKYYTHMGWGEYTTDSTELDRQTYESWGWS